MLVLVRFNRTSMPAFWPATEDAIDIMSTLRALPKSAVREQDVFVVHRVGRLTRKIHGRLCMVRLPEHEARKARKRTRQEYGPNVSADTLEAAGYIVLFTTTPASRLSAAQCIELYRLRWQIELQFKRWKTLCGFDRMPNFRPDNIASWLYAKILAAVLLEKLASLHSGIFPPIDCDDEEVEEPHAHREATVEADPVALAYARVRALCRCGFASCCPTSAPLLTRSVRSIPNDA